MKSRIRIFTVALLIVTQKWKQSKCPSARKRLNTVILCSEHRLLHSHAKSIIWLHLLTILKMTKNTEMGEHVGNCIELEIEEGHAWLQRGSMLGVLVVGCLHILTTGQASTHMDKHSLHICAGRDGYIGYSHLATPTRRLHGLTPYHICDFSYIYCSG